MIGTDPNPDYRVEPPQSLPNGWVEIDAVRWAGMLQTAAYFAKPRKEKK